MKTVRLEDLDRKVLEAEGIRGVSKQVPVGVADGSPTMSLRVFTVEPGGHTPYHSHPWEHINYILAGNGELRNADGSPRPVRAGDFALVLPNEEHQFYNSGDTDLQFICMVPTEHE
jgi:quercetin dioxygenase-like cupin family protein